MGVSGLGLRSPDLNPSERFVTLDPFKEFDENEI